MDEQQLPERAVYSGKGGRIAEVLGPTEVVLSDGSHWRGSRRPLPWTRRGTWRRGDPLGVLRLASAQPGEDYLLVNASRRCRLPDVTGGLGSSRMNAAFLGWRPQAERHGWRRWFGGGTQQAGG